MYRLMSIMLSFFLVLSLTGCGSGGSGDSASGQGTTTPSISFSGEISGEITVSAYDSMRTQSFLEEAARLFEEKYPGTKVKVETFSAMPEIKTSDQGNMRMSVVRMEDDPQGRQDYINRVNTAIMSGQGADIYSMDVLPIHKYADSGQIENLDGYIEADPQFNLADYRGNVLDALRYKDGLWLFPMNYSFNVYAYDSTLITGESSAALGPDSAFTMEELIAIGEPFFDGSSKMFNTIDYFKGPLGGNSSMWSALFKENYGSFVDVQNKAANFNDGAFTQLLETVKRQGEQGYINQGVAMQTDAGEMMRRSREEPVDRYFFKNKNTFSILSQYTRGLGGRMNVMIGGGASPGVEDDDEIAGIAKNADGSVPFTFGQAYAINSNSKNKETAWAFIKFLLSEEMQLNTNLSSITTLPLLNSARSKHGESLLSGIFARRPAAQMQETSGQVDQAQEGQQATQQGQDQQSQESQQPQESQQAQQQVTPEAGQTGQSEWQVTQNQPRQPGQPGQPRIGQFEASDIEPQPLTEEQKAALEKYNEAIERLSDQISGYVFEDVIVNDMIAFEVQGFFEGTKTAEEVAKALQNKVALYLNENG